MSESLQIAIDGPSGSGKSTLGRELARVLGLPYVDTGAMYRAVAWRTLRAGASEPVEVAALLPGLRLDVDADPEAFRVRVDGEDVTEHLRDPEVGRAASFVAALPEVRAWLLPRQRALASRGGVLEGRDIGTVVLPDADCKFFVTAAESERMSRRAAQLGTGDAETIVEDVRERDRRDKTRATAPLLVAVDAVTIDTSSESVEQSLARMLDEVRRATGA